MTEEQILKLIEEKSVIVIIKELAKQRDQFIHLYCQTSELDISERLIESNNKALENGN